MGPRELWRHRRWEKAEAKFIDNKFVRRVTQEGSETFQTWDYMVEITDNSGHQKRLVIREHSFKLDLPEIGEMVPVLVNRKRTKAIFELMGSRIDIGAGAKRQERIEKERAERRFAEKLRETGDS